LLHILSHKSIVALAMEPFSPRLARNLARNFSLFSRNAAAASRGEKFRFCYRLIAIMSH
jgi:hypothetical protein